MSYLYNLQVYLKKAQVLADLLVLSILTLFWTVCAMKYTFIWPETTKNVLYTQVLSCIFRETNDCSQIQVAKLANKLHRRFSAYFESGQRGVPMTTWSA